MGQGSRPGAVGGGDDEIVRAAVADFTQRSPAMGCRHVVRDSAGALLCSRHPQAGLLCGRCADRHTLRHDAIEEKTCDACREVVEKIHAGVASVPFSHEHVRDSKGHHRPFSGVLAVHGFGRCTPCHEAAGGKDSDIPSALLAKGWRP